MRLIHTLRFMIRSNKAEDTGGYDTQFLTGKQCFEDGSMLLGYFYYNGLVKQCWAMGLKHLSGLHQCPWHKRFFSTGDLSGQNAEYAR